MRTGPESPADLANICDDIGKVQDDADCIKRKIDNGFASIRTGQKQASRTLEKLDATLGRLNDSSIRNDETQRTLIRLLETKL